MMGINRTLRTNLIGGLSLFLALCAVAKEPQLLANYLTPGETAVGEIGVVLPPKEIEDYITKVKDSARKNPEWFTEYSSTAKPGVPLPYDERLGLTKKEYQEYRNLWNKRAFKPIHRVGVRLEEVGGKWKINVSGQGARISLLKYDPEKDVVISTNGELERIEDIKAAEESILGAWTGHEWKFEQKNSLGRIKENFAIGKMGGGKFGLIVYRLQDVDTNGRPIMDQSMIIRFAL